MLPSARWSVTYLRAEIIYWRSHSFVSMKFLFMNNLRSFCLTFFLPMQWVSELRDFTCPCCFALSLSRRSRRHFELVVDGKTGYVECTMVFCLWVIRRLLAEEKSWVGPGWCKFSSVSFSRCWQDQKFEVQ